MLNYEGLGSLSVAKGRSAGWQGRGSPWQTPAGGEKHDVLQRARFKKYLCVNVCILQLFIAFIDCFSAAAALRLETWTNFLTHEFCDWTECRCHAYADREQNIALKIGF